MDRPFDKVAIDLMGPLTVIGNKCRHILTLVDTATRWPETVPLRETCITSKLFWQPPTIDLKKPSLKYGNDGDRKKNVHTI